jgi:hypothetical protein
LPECPDVVVGQLHNSAASRQAPAIAFNAADQSLAVVVDLDLGSFAVWAGFRLITHAPPVNLRETCGAPARLSVAVFEPKDIIDPSEKCLEARSNIFDARWASAGRSRQLWLLGAAVYAFCTLIVAITLIPGTDRESVFQGRGDLQVVIPQSSQTPSPLPPTAAVPASAPPPPKQKVEEVRLQASQPTASLPDPDNAQSAAEPETPVPDQSDAHWVKVALGARLHAGPSVSTPTISFYPVGTQLRVTAWQEGWVHIVDPTTSQQGWIYEKYVAPIDSPTSAEETPMQQLSPSEQLAEQEPDTPDQSALSATTETEPSAKTKKQRKQHHAKRHRGRGIVIRFAFGRIR